MSPEGVLHALQQWDLLSTEAIACSDNRAPSQPGAPGDRHTGLGHGCSHESRNEVGMGQQRFLFQGRAG